MFRIFFSRITTTGLLSLVLLLCLILVSSPAPLVSAGSLSQDDIHAIKNDSVWHRIYSDTCGGSSSSAASTSSSGAGTAGPVYLVGDSIGTQIKDPLGTALNGSGWSFQGNVVAGRTLPEGLAVVDQDQAYIKTATAVVVELGTNAGGFDVATVSQMIDKIRDLAPSAAIYWVDTAVSQRQDYTQTLNNVNSIIYSQAAAKNYQVISWNKKVFGDSADPTNINPSAPDNGYIRLADQFVHLSDAGIPAMTDLISSTIMKGSSSSSSTCGGGAASCLVGDTNEIKIWNFLVGKGLTGPQAAGVMGNLQAESTFNPAADEAPNGTGHGIAQWSFGRRDALYAAAAAQGVSVDDLGFQLNFLFQEASGRTVDKAPYSNLGAPNEWEALKLMQSASDAALYWHQEFERSNDGADRIQGRINNAGDILSRLGSTTPPGGITSC